MSIRIFACDDDPAFTQLVELWLLDHPDLELVGTGHDRATSLDGLRRTAPDVVLLDTLDHAGPALTVSEVRDAAAGAKVIVTSGHPPDVARRFVPGAADAYVQKGFDDQWLVAAIRGVVTRASG
jgi:DNA-binding NarL/FixJ family response regulator